MSNDHKGPWGDRPKRGPGRGPSPWGNDNPRHGSGGPRRPGGGPDFDDWFKGAQDRFEHLFGGGSKGFGWLFLILLAIWGLTGFYRVQPEEHGVILTFGKWTRTQEQAGLGYHLPWPIQDILKVNVTFERRIEVGFREDTAPRFRKASTGAVADVSEESLMVTGDENIIDIDFVVLWRISEASKYLFEIRDPEITIKKVAESAMREVIGQTDIQPALAEARGQIEARTRDIMQTILDEYESGIAINGVQLQKVDPPKPVVDAFNDVQRARADKERLRNEAEAYRNDIIPRARGEAERLLQQAEAYKQEVVNRATGDADRFVSVYKSYAQAKDVTAQRLYLETLEQVLGRATKIIIDGDQGVLPYLPLNQLKPAAGGQ